MIPHYWTPEQVMRLLDTLATHDKREARTAALIMWRTGLRIGETLALQWRDIDLGGRTLLGPRFEDRIRPDGSAPR